MSQVSAGILMYRRRGNSIEVLLVHPGGPFWANKDAGAWSIPKGMPKEGEDLIATARREFAEETGFPVTGDIVPLGWIRQKSGKIVHAWAVEGNIDTSLIRSNMTTIEWPPKTGKHIEVPEVDRAAYFEIDAARDRINRSQAALLDELLRALAQ